jgi:hypothetical protein
VEQLEIKLEELRSMGELLDAANAGLLAATERLERLSDELRSLDHERALVREELRRRELERTHVTTLFTTILDVAYGPPSMQPEPAPR